MLPPPHSESAALSQALSQQLIQRIRNAPQQAISFAEYMHHALYTPGLGYYAAGLRKFGQQGDFITAPEISPLFSRALARQCAEILSVIPGSAILELGAGSGQMAAEILRALTQWNCPPQHYYVLEPSAELQHRQRATLTQLVPEWLPRITWLSELGTKPWFNGVLLANEVLDALPVHRCQVQNGAWIEWGVTWDGTQFTWCAMPLSPRLAQACAQLPAGCLHLEGYTSEICLAVEPWLLDLHRITQQAVALLIDYGFPRATYYHPQRDQGTLMCHYRHHAHPDPFWLPGLQDITAHVDFTHVAYAAHHAGWQVIGYTHQADFLLALDILADLPPQTQGKTYWAATAAVKKLLMPHEMGELFKILVLGHQWTHSLQGLATNRLSRLT